MIVFVKKSVNFWLLFKQMSEHGADKTVLLQKIVTARAAEKKEYPVILSKSSQRNAGTSVDLETILETKLINECS